MAGRIKISAGISFILLCFPMLAAAFTAQFQQGLNGYIGTADTYVRADQPTNSFASAQVVLVDNDFPIAHGIIRFDHIFGTGPGQVPHNSIIDSATLTLRTSNEGDPVWVHRMLVPWEETNNWNDFSASGGGLQADNLEMSATPDFTFTGSPPIPRVDSFDVTETVRGWLAGDFPNYGWGITNQISNGWQFDSSENGTIANRPMLTINFLPYDPPPRITQHPASSTNAEGSSVSFTVAVTPFAENYQWFKDGVPIAGATNATYRLTVVRRSDAGTYTVWLANSFGEATSDPAILTVIPDETPPSLLCAYGTNDTLTIFVVFSEIVTNATNPANYSLFPTDDPSQPLLVATAMHPGGATEGSTVALTLQTDTPIVFGRSYSLNVGGISDRFGNPIDPNIGTPISLYARRVFAISESHVWKYNDSGLDLSNTWTQPNFDDSTWSLGPPLFGFENAPLPEPLRTPLSLTNGSGNRIITYYFRTHFDSSISGSGVLRFRTVLDDAAAIYLNGAEIFRLRLPAGPLNYMTQGLIAVGDAAYEGPFTVCVTNLLSGDNVLAVEVHQTGPVSGDMVFGMELFSMSSTPPADCFFIRHPTNQLVQVGSSVTFSVDMACPSLPWTYQWFKDQGPIIGATNASHTINPVRLDHDGVYWVVASASPIYTYESAAARLRVFSCCPPQLISIYVTNETVVLLFDEVTTNGLDTSNFAIVARDGSHELTIDSTRYTTLTNTGSTLLLRLDPITPFTPDTAYNLYLEDIEDLFGNRIDPTTVPIPLFPITIFGIGQSWRYETSGTDFSNAWYRLDYNDSAWPLGPALFDAKRPPRSTVGGQPVRTMTTLSNSTATAQIPTHYFRTRFNYSGPVSNIVCIRPFVDDGAVFYLNGQDIFRVGFSPPAAPVNYNTLAARTVTDAAFEGPFYVPVTNLVPGENLLAVEVHQSSIVSSDLTFGTEFGLLLTEPPPRLRISISPDGTEIILTWNGSATLEQNTSLNPAAWNEVQGATSGYRTPRTSMQFFRLREP